MKKARRLIFTVLLMFIFSSAQITAAQPTAPNKAQTIWGIIIYRYEPDLLYRNGRGWYVWELGWADVLFLYAGGGSSTSATLHYFISCSNHRYDNGITIHAFNYVTGVYDLLYAKVVPGSWYNYWSGTVYLGSYFIQSSYPSHAHIRIIVDVYGISDYILYDEAWLDFH